MPRCMDWWRFSGDTVVGMTASSADPAQQYSLIYMLFNRDRTAERLPGGSFDSAQLRQGVQWTVPEGYRCELQLVTTSNGAIDTQISLRGAPATCNPGTHCQGPCTPVGAAGLAGSWAVTAARRP
ncbi:MAG: hypothetical protein AAF657_24225 [Acidobacteriota bacterium]